MTPCFQKHRQHLFHQDSGTGVDQLYVSIELPPSTAQQKNYFSREPCNLTLDQSTSQASHNVANTNHCTGASSARQTPHIMLGNMKVLKSPRLPPPTVTVQPNPRLPYEIPKVNRLQEYKLIQKQRPIPSDKDAFLTVSCYSSIKEELQSRGGVDFLGTEGDQSLMLIATGGVTESQARIAIEDLGYNQSKNQKVVYESVLSPTVNPMNPGHGVSQSADLNQYGNQSISIDNQKADEQEIDAQFSQLLGVQQRPFSRTHQELGQNFTKALKSFIRKELQRIILMRSANGMRHEEHKKHVLTFDTLQGAIRVEGQRSYSKSQEQSAYIENQQIENSIEEEIIHEIQQSLGAKIDGLKALFIEMGQKVQQIKEQEGLLESGSPSRVEEEPSLVDSLNRSSNRHGLPIDPNKHIYHSEDNSIQQLVNASDLDRWVRQAEDYRELYEKAELELQEQAERYENIIADIKESYSCSCSSLIPIMTDCIDRRDIINLEQIREGFNVPQTIETLIDKLNKLIQLQRPQSSSHQKQYLTAQTQLHTHIRRPHDQLPRQEDSSFNSSNRSHQISGQQSCHSVTEKQSYESKIRHLEGEMRLLKEERETQDLEIRHLKLMNNSALGSQNMGSMGQAATKFYS
ncbi:hypothetical protein FGO68_gene9048 [Halteria grandinella]|uniref:Uncharacterized protein n=1 Tax=Halteria grandinella TaxID=5974 RepID=A0A8J8NUF2_HALGN|nr:hypothetical protein FGO68_gene9048 [Halteria grandinella]